MAVLLDRCGVYRSSLPDWQASEQTHLTAFNEGWRACGLSYLKEMQGIDKLAFLLMFKEQEAQSD
jgi:hypothetical protein